MNSNYSVLLIEDEPNLGKTLRDYLKTKKFNVSLGTSVAEGKQLAVEIRPTVAILDIGLPDGSGLDLARFLRSEFKECAILFCSALNDPLLKVEGLELGAEDYITKPFDLRELTLRLERILKNRHQTYLNPDELIFGRLKFWPKRFEIGDADGKTISLGQKECAILELLLFRKNEVVSRDEIIEQIWGEDSFPTNRTVDNYIVKLRKWTDSDETGAIKIQSIRGIGYKLELKGMML